MIGFEYQALPMHVVFRVGAVDQLGDELVALGLSRVLLLCTPFEEPLAQRISAQLGALSIGVYPHAAQHVPVEVAEAARQKAKDSGADGFVSIGGGSTTGLGKAIALTSALPVVAVPTTYAGSEMTTVWGMTEDGRKTTGRDLRVLPKAVIYDPALSVSLPVPMSVTSGFNAIAHAAEALYAPDASPIISLMAVDGVRAMVSALPRVFASPEDIDARSDALYGAWLCGAVLGATTMGLHHKLCHVLGGAFGLPHAEMHTVVLPYVLDFNAPFASEQLARATGFASPAAELRSLALRLGAPGSLGELGLTDDDVDEAVTMATESPYSNPRAVTPGDIRSILLSALNGEDIAASAPGTD